jgi:hypothetical protein
MACELASPVHLDEFYEYDEMNRLSGVDRGNVKDDGIDVHQTATGNTAPRGQAARWRWGTRSRQKKRGPESLV